MNYLQAIKFGSYKLKLNNIESHILDSELLLSFVLKSSREQILTKLNIKVDFFLDRLGRKKIYKICNASNFEKMFEIPKLAEHY